MDCEANGLVMPQGTCRAAMRNGRTCADRCLGPIYPEPDMCELQGCTCCAALGRLEGCVLMDI